MDDDEGEADEPVRLALRTSSTAHHSTCTSRSHHPHLYSTNTTLACSKRPARIRSCVGCAQAPHQFCAERELLAHPKKHHGLPNAHHRRGGLDPHPGLLPGAAPRRLVVGGGGRRRRRHPEGKRAAELGESSVIRASEGVPPPVLPSLTASTPSPLLHSGASSSPSSRGSTCTSTSTPRGRRRRTPQPRPPLTTPPPPPLPPSPTASHGEHPPPPRRQML
jgi:hypothetical protein